MLTRALVFTLIVLITIGTQAQKKIFFSVAGDRSLRIEQGCPKARGYFVWHYFFQGIHKF